MCEQDNYVFDKTIGINEIYKELESKAVKKRTMCFYNDLDELVININEIVVLDRHGLDFKFYVSWVDVDFEDNEEDKWLESIAWHKACCRAKDYFPSFLDMRIPPENRIGIEDILRKEGLEYYDKFDFAIKCGARTPINYGYVKASEYKQCPYKEISFIELILKSLERTEQEMDTLIQEFKVNS